MRPYFPVVALYFPSPLSYLHPLFTKRKLFITSWWGRGGAGAEILLEPKKIKSMTVTENN